MKTILYEAVLDSPAMFSRFDGDPNSMSTQLFIPGSVLWGAMAHRLISRNREMTDPVSNPLFRKLFFSGKVRFLHAYPSSDALKEKQMLPVPLSFYMKKDDIGSDSGNLLDRADLDSEDIDDSSQLVRSDMGFIRITGSKAFYRKPSTKRHMHYAVNRENDKRSIFHYESLISNERFIGAIEIDLSDSDEEIETGKTIQDLMLSAPLRLGRSRSTEYGGNVKLNILGVKDRFLEFDSRNETSENLVVTLLSDYGSKGGETSIETFIADLSEHLNISDLKLKTRFVKEDILSGYNAYWKMPRPALPVLIQGSVFVFERPDWEIPSCTFSIGNRLSEGYGRVAIGWHGFESDEGLLRFEKDMGFSSPILDASTNESAELKKFKSGLAYEWYAEQIPVKVTKIVFRDRKIKASNLASLRSLDAASSESVNDRFIENRLGKQVDSKLSSTKIDIPGWDPQRISLKKMFLEICSGKKPDRLCHYLEFDMKIPEFIKACSMLPEHQLRLRQVFIEVFLDHLRRLAVMEES